MSRRTTTPDERAQFEEAFSEARPTRKIPKPKLPVPAAAARAAVAEKGGGLDGRTSERLRRGMLDPEARLDLHGYTESDAHRALLVFLRSAQSRGLKLVLVVTGKGGRAPDAHAPFDMELDRRSRGVLKSAVPRWLKEPGFAFLIAGTRDAHRRHGGTGALYIYLRKGR
jgi:DNA-nicking Smr family endonuclease